MKLQLHTKAWAGLDSPDSNLGKYLLSSAFKNPKNGTEADQIDVDYLLLFGVLHCRDKAKCERKAIGFYDILQEGGMESHGHISAGDKDFEPVWRKLVEFCTTDLFDMAKEVKTKYSDAEAKQIEDVIEDMQEDFLDLMYGNNSSLKNDAWLEKILSPDCIHVFDAAEIRRIAFEKAEVEAKHIK